MRTPNYKNTSYKNWKELRDKNKKNKKVLKLTYQSIL